MDSKYDRHVSPEPDMTCWRVDRRSSKPKDALAMSARSGLRLGSQEGWEMGRGEERKILPWFGGVGRGLFVYLESTY